MFALALTLLGLLNMAPVAKYSYQQCLKQACGIDVTNFTPKDYILHFEDVNSAMDCSNCTKTKDPDGCIDYFECDPVPVAKEIYPSFMKCLKYYNVPYKTFSPVQYVYNPPVHAVWKCNTCMQCYEQCYEEGDYSQECQKLCITPMDMCDDLF